MPHNQTNPPAHTQCGIAIDSVCRCRRGHDRHEQDRRAPQHAGGRGCVAHHAPVLGPVLAHLAPARVQLREPRRLRAASLAVAQPPSQRAAHHSESAVHRRYHRSQRGVLRFSHPFLGHQHRAPAGPRALHDLEHHRQHALRPLDRRALGGSVFREPDQRRGAGRQRHANADCRYCHRHCLAQRQQGTEYCCCKRWRCFCFRSNRHRLARDLGQARLVHDVHLAAACADSTRTPACASKARNTARRGAARAARHSDHRSETRIHGSRRRRPWRSSRITTRRAIAIGLHHYELCFA